MAFPKALIARQFENGSMRPETVVPFAKSKIGKFRMELADFGGPEEIRILDPYNANVVRSRGRRRTGRRTRPQNVFLRNCVSSLPANGKYGLFISYGDAPPTHMHVFPPGIVYCGGCAPRLLWQRMRQYAILKTIHFEFGRERYCNELSIVRSRNDTG